ncbi:M23 family metallopeptidase [Streptomyces sp. NPDC005438]|uniref:M23 family metallopeptidase n=1 Tax=Streptomyces sp. NPDC005438 TaxID=3156880 RepID=UPI0033A49DAD
MMIVGGSALAGVGLVTGIATASVSDEGQSRSATGSGAVDRPLSGSLDDQAETQREEAGGKGGSASGEGKDTGRKDGAEDSHQKRGDADAGGKKPGKPEDSGKKQQEKKAAEKAQKAEAEKKAKEKADKEKADKEKADKERKQKADRSQRSKPAPKPKGWVSPIDGGKVTTPYKSGGALWSSGKHSGIDFAAGTGTKVRSVSAGTVVVAGDGGAYGNNIVVRHNDGTFTQYGHLSKFSVSLGQSVKAGQQIALSGSTGNSTGPHLHFEARTTPNYGSDMDPVNYLRQHEVHV